MKWFTEIMRVLHEADKRAMTVLSSQGFVRRESGMLASSRTLNQKSSGNARTKRGANEDFLRHQTYGQIVFLIPQLDVVLPTEAGLGRSSKRNIPYVAIYNNNLRIEYTQELGNNGDKVRRYLELKSKDTAIVTGEISKGREQQHKERDLIIIPPLRVKYSTYHQHRKVSARNKSSRRRSAARSDSSTTPVYYMFMSEFPTSKKAIEVSSDFADYYILEDVQSSYKGKIEEAYNDIKHIRAFSKRKQRGNASSSRRGGSGDMATASKRRLVLDRDNEYFDKNDIMWQFNPAVKLSGVDNFDLSIKGYLAKYFKVETGEEDEFPVFGSVMENMVNNFLDPIMYNVVKMSHNLDLNRSKM